MSSILLNILPNPPLASVGSPSTSAISFNESKVAGASTSNAVN